MLDLANIRERFERHVVRTSGCWGWRGSKTEHGYGRLSLGGRGAKIDRAHRVSWLLNFGPVPPGIDVCHKCDNPECSRPDHLFLGTRSDNMKDCVSKGRDRSVTARGSYSSPNMGRPRGSTKFSAEQIFDVRARFERGETHRAIAAASGVGRTAVGRITKSCTKCF